MPYSEKHNDSFFKVRCPRTGRLILHVLKDFPQKDDPNLKVSPETYDELLTATLREHRDQFFRFLDFKRNYYQDKLTGLTVPEIYFPSDPRYSRLPYESSGFFSEDFRALILQLDTVYMRIEACRLMGLLGVEEYHRHVRQLEGGTFNAFLRLRRAFSKVLKDAVSMG